MPKIEQGHNEEGFRVLTDVKKAEQNSVCMRPLDTGWQMRQVGKENWFDCRVPNTNFMTLYEANEIPDPFHTDNELSLQWIEKEDWEYRLTFDISVVDLLHHKIELVFDGLDTYADIYVNDQLVMQADNMFLKWHLSCKKYLRSGSNDIRIYFHSPLKKVQAEFEKGGITFPAENDKSENHLSVFTRKAPYHYGWDWGPKFVTSGIWRPVSLRLVNDLVIRNLQIHQEEIKNDKASFTTAIAVESSRQQSCRITAKLDDIEIGVNEVLLVEGINDCVLNFDIREVERWWPAGMGEQVLYKVSFVVSGEDYSDHQTNRVGVRDFEVINAPDKQGESFYFKVNGMPYFAKGANYIPSDSFLDRMTPERYRQLFEDAVAANMNMLRVWGGGIYEDDLFYDLADEYGIVIWQDFMFACTMYPWSNKFLENIEKEAVSNIRRLRNHPSVGLWCGNNEIQMGWDNWGWQKSFNYSQEDQKKIYQGYQSLFHDLLPKLVNEYDSDRFYFPSSPISNWDSIEKFSYGDQHYWGVWHGEEPFENFKKFVPRFMSEFGFQSFPILESVTKYIEKADLTIHSKPMQVHQKHPRGNQLIHEYMLRDFKEPKDFENFLYLSQVVQAKGMTIAFEAHRRNMPFCMGSLYWQFNDCWPVASWSGIDYYGRWKALHYAARSAFTNVLISFDQLGSELHGYVISDIMKDYEAILKIEVMDFSGSQYYYKISNILIKSGESQVYFKESIKKLLKDLDKTNAVLKATLHQGADVLSQTLYYFSPPKQLKLDEPKISQKVTLLNETIQVTLNSDTLAKNVYLSMKGVEGNFSDNFFDLLPNTNKTVTVPLPDAYSSVSPELKILTVNDASSDL